MTALEALIKLAGEWQGTNQLWLTPAEMPQKSQSTASITPVIKGKFVRIDYTWTFEGEAQAGLMVCGYDPQEAKVTVVWADSMHMGDKFMICQGAAQADGALDVRGSYSVPGHPDWGWRMVIGPGENGAFRLVMYNITPEGQEHLAVEANYSRP
jgi:hypothetical protein